MKRAERQQRDDAIAQAYRGGARLEEIRLRFGLSLGRVSQIVHAKGQGLGPIARASRTAAANRRKAADPAFRARLRESGLKAWAEGRGPGGRPKGSGQKLFFASDAERKQYRKLRDAIGVAEARQQMGFAA